jgi:hypothetical protein
MEESFNSSTGMPDENISYTPIYFSMCLFVKKVGGWVRHENRII